MSERYSYTEYRYNGILIGTSLSGASGTGFDVTPYKKLYIEARTTAANKGKIGLVRNTGNVSGLHDEDAYSLSPGMVRSVVPLTERTVQTIDVSSLSGDYFIAALSPLGSGHLYIYNIWFE